MDLKNLYITTNFHQSLGARKPGSTDSNEAKLEVPNNAINVRSHDGDHVQNLWKYMILKCRK